MDSYSHDVRAVSSHLAARHQRPTEAGLNWVGSEVAEHSQNQTSTSSRIPIIEPRCGHMDPTMLSEEHFLTDVRHTGTQLLQHLLLIVLLSVHLYTLPVLLVVRKLVPGSQRSDTSHSNKLPLSEREQLGTNPLHHPIQQRLAETVGCLCRAMLLPFRLAYHLYCLADVIEQHPEFLRYRPDSSAARSGQINKSSSPPNLVHVSDENYSQPGSATSASRLDNAAISDDETLGDLFSSLGDGDQACVKEVETGMSKEQENDYKSAGELAPSSSLQQTPDTIHPLQTTLVVPGHISCLAVIQPERYNINGTKHETSPVANSENDISSKQEDSAPECCNISSDTEAVLTLDCEGESNSEVKRCPTFERRQALSKLPRKVTSESTAVPELVGKMQEESPVSVKSSPSKPNKLRRRVRK